MALGNASAQKPQRPAALQATGVSKAFGNVPVLHDINLEVNQGEFLTLLGPSGCGKTTLLNILAGFFPPDTGAVVISGKEVTHTPPHLRDTAMVFQNYALFPHLTVAQNVAFGLQMRRRMSKSSARAEVAAVLNKVKMSGMEDRYPNALSGGQQQRVALARAIVLKPALLLLDEPLSNLDARLRETMQLELRSLQRDIGITTILVTHDQAEAFVVSDRIAVMHAGRIEQLATPDEIYRRPRSAIVADFVGRMNWLPGYIADEGRFEADLGGVQCRVPIRTDSPPGTEGLLLLRPEHVQLRAARGDADVELAGDVASSIFLGPTTHYHVQVGSMSLLAYQPGPSALLPGPVWVSWSAADAHFLPEVEPTPDG